jgi:hypothetical protein
MLVSDCSEASLHLPLNKFRLDGLDLVSGHTSVELSTDVGLSNESSTVCSFSIVGSALFFVLLVEHIFVLSSLLTPPEKGSALVERRTLLECAGRTCTELGEMGFISNSFLKTAGGTVPFWTALQSGDGRLRETIWLFSAVSNLLAEKHKGTGGGGVVGL